MLSVLLITNSFTRKRWRHYINERYWFDERDEVHHDGSKSEFEQSPAIEQLFQVYYRAAGKEEEGEWLLAADILQRIQKAAKMKFSSGQATHFGRILRRLGVESFKENTWGLLSCSGFGVI